MHEGGRCNRFTEDWNSDEDPDDDYEINDEEISKIIIGECCCLCLAIHRRRRSNGTGRCTTNEKNQAKNMCFILRVL